MKVTLPEQIPPTPVSIFSSVYSRDQNLTSLILYPTTEAAEAHPSCISDLLNVLQVLYI